MVSKRFATWQYGCDEAEFARGEEYTRWCESGDVPFETIGRHVLFHNGTSRGPASRVRSTCFKPLEHYVRYAQENFPGVDFSPTELMAGRLYTGPMYIPSPPG